MFQSCDQVAHEVPVAREVCTKEPVQVSNCQVIMGHHHDSIIADLLQVAKEGLQKCGSECTQDCGQEGLLRRKEGEILRN